MDDLIKLIVQICSVQATFGTVDVSRLAALQKDCQKYYATCYQKESGYSKLTTCMAKRP